jgi:hypothetical protein
MTTTTGTGDTGYEQTNNVLSQIKDLTDSFNLTPLINAAGQLADGLPAMIPDDSETVGHTADVMAHLQRAEQEKQAAAEAAAAAIKSHIANFGAQHEAVNATGHDAERGYHGVS